MLRRPAVVPMLAAPGLFLMAGVAGAHTGEREPPTLLRATPVAASAAPMSAETIAAAAPATPGVAWPVVLLVVLAPALARRRSLKLAAAGLAVVLAVFAFEAAFHSVHHGLDPAAEAACPTASAATHVAGTGAAVLAFDAPLPLVGPALVAPHVVVRLLDWLRPHPGRAPPSALA